MDPTWSFLRLNSQEWGCWVPGAGWLPGSHFPERTIQNLACSWPCREWMLGSPCVRHAVSFQLLPILIPAAPGRTGQLRVTSPHRDHFPGPLIQSAPASWSEPLTWSWGCMLPLRDIPPGCGSMGTSERTHHTFTLSHTGSAFPAMSFFLCP